MLITPLNTIISLYFNLILFMYIVLYNKRNLPYNIKAFIVFRYTRIRILCPYFFSFYLLYHTKPFYLHQRSAISLYRYTRLFLISIISILLYMLSFYNLRISALLNIFKYPDLKEGIYAIMYALFEGTFCSICIRLIHKLSASKMFHIVFLMLHFSCLCLYRLLLLTWCCFLEGDYTYLLLLNPLSFIIGIVNFFRYYFSVSLHNNANYAREIVIIPPLIKTPVGELTHLYQPGEITIEFSFFGRSGDIPSFWPSWLELANVNSLFIRDYRYIIPTTSFLLLRYFLNRVYISSIVFLSDSTMTTLGIWPVMKSSILYPKPWMEQKKHRIEFLLTAGVIFKDPFNSK